MTLNDEAQKHVAWIALAHIKLDIIQYVKTHATFTFVRDPMKIRAMFNVYEAN